MIASILIVQFVGIPFSFLFGIAGRQIGAKRSILLGLLVYTGICVVGYFMRTDRDFLILAVLVGMVQGGTQALSRSLFASLIPRDKSGEFFGFFAVVEKFAGIFGPALVRRHQPLTGSSRGAILGVIGFFVVGGVLALAGRRRGRPARGQGRRGPRMPAALSSPASGRDQCLRVMIPGSRHVEDRIDERDQGQSLDRRVDRAGSTSRAGSRSASPAGSSQTTPEIVATRLSRPGCDGYRYLLGTKVSSARASMTARQAQGPSGRT